MATIKSTYGDGGSMLSPRASGVPSLAEVLRDLADDLQTMGAAFNATLAKLDADAGVTDADYASLHGLDLTALKHQKG